MKQATEDEMGSPIAEEGKAKRGSQGHEMSGDAEDASREQPSRCLTYTPLSKHLDVSKLPLTVERLPPTITSLQECARHQIQTLLSKEKDSSQQLTLEEEDALDDGFFLCDLNVVRRKLLIWNQLFPRVAPFYAVKCNPDPMVTAVVGQMCIGGFDCASVPEIELALASACGNADDDNTHRIVYANPQRAEQHLDRALALKIRALTFDGPEELHKVHRAYQKQLLAVSQQHQSTTTTTDAALPPPLPEPPSMILRILVPDQHSSVPLGEKFGAPLDQVADLAALAQQLDLELVGVSFHGGSGNHNPASYLTAIELAHDAMQQINRVLLQHNNNKACWLLDIGGGFPGVDGVGGDVGRFCGSTQSASDRLFVPQDDVTAAKIAQVVTPRLHELLDDAASKEQPIMCIAEPGRYFVEAAYVLCSRIYRVQTSNDGSRHYYIAQGVQGVFKDCLLCHETYVPIPLSLQTDLSLQSENVPSTIHGPSGEDYDVICRDYPLPALLGVGDWLLFDRMGAYTMSIAARNGRPPVRYVLGGGASEM